MIKGKPVQGLFLRTELARGKTQVKGKEVEFEVSINIDNRAIFVEFPETKIEYSTNDIVSDAIDTYEKWLSSNEAKKMEEK